MKQAYLCPNCSAQIVCSEVFCINCGVSLKWIVQQTPSQSPDPSYSCQPPEQQKISDHPRPLQRQLEHGLQSEGAKLSLSYEMTGGRCQHQQKEAEGNSHTSSHENASFNDNVAPISTDIVKLLATMLNKHAEYDKVK